MHPYRVESAKIENMETMHKRYANLRKLNTERPKKFCCKSAAKLVSPNIVGDDHYDFGGMFRMLSSIDDFVQLQQRHDDA